MTPKRIKVHVLTGFLGSGKTTLLNWALATAFGSETAVIVSEFGEVALDDVLIAARSEETLVMKSGCVCCLLRVDLVTTLMEIAARADAERRPLDRVVIETSGMSDPMPVLQTLQSDFNLLARFEIASTLCTVDPTMPERDRNRREALIQIASADHCIITKVDLVNEAAITRTAAWIAETNPVAEVTRSGEVHAATLFARIEPEGLDLDARLSRLPSPPAPGKHGMESRVLRIAEQPSWPAFAVWLSALLYWHGDRLLRIKGVLWDGERGTWIAVHTVRRFIYPPEHLSRTSMREPGACLVFIGEQLDFPTIERSYRQWVLQG